MMLSRMYGEGLTQVHLGGWPLKKQPVTSERCVILMHCSVVFFSFSINLVFLEMKGPLTDQLQTDHIELIVCYVIWAPVSPRQHVVDVLYRYYSCIRLNILLYCLYCTQLLTRLNNQLKTVCSSTQVITN